MSDRGAKAAEIVREYGPFDGVENVRGVTFDGDDVWFASEDGLRAFDPASGAERRRLPTRADAGTTFDGRHLHQIAGDRIVRIDRETGEVLGSIPLPAGCTHAGLTWAEGALWVADHRGRKIRRLDPATGEVTRTLDAARFVTGVTFVDGDLWYGTWEGGSSDLRRADPRTGEVLETLAMPADTIVSGLEYDGKDTLYCGGGTGKKVRAVRRPRPAART